MKMEWKVISDNTTIALCPDWSIATLILTGLYGEGLDNLRIERVSSPPSRLFQYQVSIPTNKLFNGEPWSCLVVAYDPEEARSLAKEEASDIKAYLWDSAKVEKLGTAFCKESKIIMVSYVS